MRNLSYLQLTNDKARHPVWRRLRNESSDDHDAHIGT